MEDKVEEYLRHEDLGMTSNGSSEEDAKSDDFMDVISTHEIGRSKKSLRKRAQDMVAKWLEGKLVETLDDATFMHEQVFIDLFIRLGTL